MSPLPRQEIFGIPFTVSSLDNAAEHFVQQASLVAKATLIAHADVHVLTRALGEKDYGAKLATFDYICPDGMPIVWLMRKKKKVDAHRLYGPDMMERVCELGCQSEQPVRHFLLGGSEEAQRLLQEKFKARFPDLIIAGSYSPPMGEWPEGEHERIGTLIRESGANCVWVGLGCPKQERWLAEQLDDDTLPPALYFAVGAAFNFHAGLVSQAPLWIRQRGFEWLYRLCKEPRRLFKRYFVHIGLFFWFLLTRKV